MGFEVMMGDNIPCPFKALIVGEPVTVESFESDGDFALSR
jgi:hypothetical protein